MPPSTGRLWIRPFRVRVCIESHADGSIAERIERHLPAAAIEHPNQLVQGGGSHRGVAAIGARLRGIWPRPGRFPLAGRTVGRYSGAAALEERVVRIFA